MVALIPLVPYDGFVHENPDCGTHPLGVPLPPLNRPSANNKETMIAMTNMAHPYVIRYSIADWALRSCRLFIVMLGIVSSLLRVGAFL